MSERQCSELELLIRHVWAQKEREMERKCGFGHIHWKPSVRNNYAFTLERIFRLNAATINQFLFHVLSTIALMGKLRSEKSLPTSSEKKRFPKDAVH